VIAVIIGATGTISKSFRKYLSNIPPKHEIPQQHTSKARNTSATYLQSTKYLSNIPPKHKIPQQHISKARNQVTTQNSHTGQCTRTAESAYV
jgi:hypothetical protein